MNGGGIDVCVEWTKLFGRPGRWRPLVGEIVEQVCEVFELSRA